MNFLGPEEDITCYNVKCDDGIPRDLYRCSGEQLRSLIVTRAQNKQTCDFELWQDLGTRSLPVQVDIVEEEGRCVIAYKEGLHLLVIPLVPISQP